jgi:hypothetical protein
VVLLTRRGGRHRWPAPIGGRPPQNRSQGWPASNRNGGRLQIGMVDRLQAGRVADIKSERVAGLRRNLQRLPPGLTDAMRLLLSFVPAQPGQQLAQQRAVAALERALEARRDRIILSQTAIAPIQWIVIVMLAALVLLTVAMVHIDRLVTTAINLFVYSTAVAACLALLIVYDGPFAAGGSSVEPTALRDISVI